MIAFFVYRMVPGKVADATKLSPLESAEVVDEWRT